MRKICVSLPYPQLTTQSDFTSATIIGRAFASSHSELTALMQYTYHSLIFKGLNDLETAEILEGISICEMKHFEILGCALYQLGVDPIFTTLPPYKYGFFTTSCVQFSKTPQKMLMDDISAELVGIEEYRKMLTLLNNEQVGAIISRIILDEELHVKTLKARLEQICAKN